MSTLVEAIAPRTKLPVAADGPSMESKSETLADLVDRLGGIPLHRIQLVPAPGTAVEADVVRRRMCELIDGVIVEKAMSYFESRLAMVLVWYLETYLQANKLGYVVGPDAQTRVGRGRVRIPDVSFVSWSRVPDGRVPTEPIGPIAPDLAVEILSPGNTRGEMEEKRIDLFAGGTLVVWVVDPDLRQAEVYLASGETRVIKIDENLEATDLLPGFSLSLKEWFERASGR